MARRRTSPDAAALDAASRCLLSVTVTGLEAVDPPVPAGLMRALLVLEESGPLNLGALAEGMSLSLSATSRTCDRLVEAALIVRETSPHSRREIRLSLAPAGRKALKQLHAARQGAFAAVLQQMAADDVAQLLNGLQAFTAAATGQQVAAPSIHLVADRTA